MLQLRNKIKLVFIVLFISILLLLVYFLIKKDKQADPVNKNKLEATFVMGEATSIKENSIVITSDKGTEQKKDIEVLVDKNTRIFKESDQLKSKEKFEQDLKNYNADVKLGKKSFAPSSRVEEKIIFSDVKKGDFLNIIASINKDEISALEIEKSINPNQLIAPSDEAPKRSVAMRGRLVEKKGNILTLTNEENNFDSSLEDFEIIIGGNTTLIKRREKEHNVFKKELEAYKKSGKEIALPDPFVEAEVGVDDLSVGAILTVRGDLEDDSKNILAKEIIIEQEN